MLKAIQDEEQSCIIFDWLIFHHLWLVIFDVKWKYATLFLSWMPFRQTVWWAEGFLRKHILTKVQYNSNKCLYFKISSFFYVRGRKSDKSSFENVLIWNISTFMCKACAGRRVFFSLVMQFLSINSITLLLSVWSGDRGE